MANASEEAQQCQSGHEGGRCDRTRWEALCVSAALLQLTPLAALAQYGDYDRSATQLRTYTQPQPLLPRPFSDRLAPGTVLREWDVRTSLLLEETYTDNVRLRPPGSEHSDWVTAARPVLNIVRNAPRSRLNLTYAPQVLYRANEETHDVYHYLQALGQAEFVPDVLYGDAQASITQQNISALGPQAQSNVNNTSNRTAVNAYSLSPYLRHDFGADAESEARFTRSTVTYSNARQFNSDSNRVDLQVNSGTAFRLLTWSLGYQKEQIDYTETGQRVDLERAVASARRLVLPTLGIRGTVGYEDNRYASSGVAPKGPFWSAGPEWTPTPRTRLAATVGHRYFGSTHSLDFSHRTRLTTWKVTYSEDITTTRGQVLVPVAVDTATFLDTLLTSRIPDPGQRQTAVNNFISATGVPSTLSVPLNFVTTAPFLEKRLLASFGIQGTRNTVLADVFRVTREVASGSAAGAGDFLVTPNIKQTGVSALWTLRITGQTSSTLTAGYVRSQFASLGREDNLKNVRLSLTKELSPRVTGTVAVRRLWNDSNQPVGIYRENAITAALNIRF